jgi:hypothetical protein
MRATPAPRSRAGAVQSGPVARRFPISRARSAVFGGFAALSLALSISAPAEAQPPRGDAPGLFQRGRELYDKKRFDEACELLAQSDRMEPAVGTLGLLASCEEERGRLAAAFRAYVETAERAKLAKDPREAFARERAGTLRERVGFLIVRTKGSEPGLEVTCQGQRLRIGELVAFDPGRHSVAARAPGKREAVMSVTVGVRQTVEVSVPELAAEGSAPGSTGDGSGAAGSPWPLQRTLGWVGVGVGGAGVVLGVIAGGVVLAKQGDLDDDPGCPDACRDRDAVSSYNTMRGVSSAGFIAGGVVLAAGVVLVLTAPRAARSANGAPRFAPSAGGFAYTF